MLKTVNTDGLKTKIVAKFMGFLTVNINKKDNIAGSKDEEKAVAAQKAPVQPQQAQQTSAKAEPTEVGVPNF